MRRAYFLTGLAAIPLAAWALQGVEWRAVLAALSSGKPGALAWLLAVNAAITLLLSARWWLILRSQGYRLPYLSLAAYRLAGFAVSYFTPGTQFGGEPLQIYLLNQRNEVPAPAALASVTLDKLLELLANSAFLILGVAAITLGGLLHGVLPAAALTLAGLLFTGLAGYTAALWLGHAPLGWLLRQAAPRSQPDRHSHTRADPAAGWPGRRMSRIRGLLGRAAQVIAAAEAQAAGLCRQQPRLVVQASLLSWLVLGSMLVEFWLCLHFFGMPATILQALSLMAMARLTFLAPLPGALGAFEAGQVLAFSALGFPVAPAVALSLFVRARDVSLGVMGLAAAAALSKKGRTVELQYHAIFNGKEPSR